MIFSGRFDITVMTLDMDDEIDHLFPGATLMLDVFGDRGRIRVRLDFQQILARSKDSCLTSQLPPSRNPLSSILLPQSSFVKALRRTEALWRTGRRRSVKQATPIQSFVPPTPWLDDYLSESSSRLATISRKPANLWSTEMYSSRLTDQNCHGQ